MLSDRFRNDYKLSNFLNVDDAKIKRGNTSCIAEQVRLGRLSLCPGLFGRNSSNKKGKLNADTVQLHQFANLGFLESRA